MAFNNNKKGQGALEYLLLIGGAVLIAAVVLSSALSLTNNPGTQQQVTVAKCSPLPVDRCNFHVFSDFDNDGEADCGWNAPANACVGCKTVDPVTKDCTAT